MINLFVDERALAAKSSVTWRRNEARLAHSCYPRHDGQSRPFPPLAIDGGNGGWRELQSGKKQGSIMITEIAQIDVKPGTEAEFEKGVKQAVPLFRRAKGCRSMELRRSIEKPTRYRLFIGWDTVENHTNDFRGSADFQEWRKLVAHCFASPPDVEHVNEVVKGF
jgi:quinol monooxygenase YgiN